MVFQDMANGYGGCGGPVQRPALSSPLKSYVTCTSLAMEDSFSEEIQNNALVKNKPHNDEEGVCSFSEGGCTPNGRRKHHEGERKLSKTDDDSLTRVCETVNEFQEEIAQPTTQKGLAEPKEGGNKSQVEESEQQPEQQQQLQKPQKKRQKIFASSRKSSTSLSLDSLNLMLLKKGMKMLWKLPKSVRLS